MNIENSKYSKYNLCLEMMETADVVADFNQNISADFISLIKKKKKILITGEGSSRIFPAKRFMYQSLACGVDYNTITDGSTQALEYKLDEYVVFGVSNSGKTRELIDLFSHLKECKHDAFFGITATPATLLTTLSLESIILLCGKENAVAATKSVIEQALFFDSLRYNYLGTPMPSLTNLSANISETLSSTIDEKIINTVCNAPIIYFSGRNDGVAEELTLKTNEITRKKSVFLEGTYALHGIEEVMNKGEVLIVIEPFEQEEEKFRKVLIEGVGIEVIAISSRETSFPTIRIPEGGDYRNYIELAAGWSLLAEVGISLGINLDKPIRARKIGNEGTINVLAE